MADKEKAEPDFMELCKNTTIQIERSLNMLSPNAKMPCFVHHRCSSREGCPESVPFQESTIGLSHPNCSKCPYNEGTCLNCALFDTGECPMPRRCKYCEFYLKRYDYGYCEYTKNAVLPDFFCAGYKQKETP